MNRLDDVIPSLFHAARDTQKCHGPPHISDKCSVVGEDQGAQLRALKRLIGHLQQDDRLTHPASTSDDEVLPAKIVEPRCRYRSLDDPVHSAPVERCGSERLEQGEVRRENLVKDLRRAE